MTVNRNLVYLRCADGNAKSSVIRTATRLYQRCYVSFEMIKISLGRLIKLIVRLIIRELACGLKQKLVGTSIATLSPTSTESNDPSSQTEKVSVETEFGSYKALVVVAYQAHCSSNPTRACVWMATRSCRHFNSYTISYKYRVKRSIIANTNREDVAYQAHCLSNRGWQQCLVGTSIATLSPTSTESNDPSSQTKKVSVETEFGSYKALVVVELTKLIVCPIQRELACGWQQGLVGTSIATPSPTSTDTNDPSSQTQTEKMFVETKF
eukprot:scaffold4098_cov154-Skeletonema_marinoi.AAC.1